jgi:hypothetical protein
MCLTPHPSLLNADHQFPREGNPDGADNEHFFQNEFLAGGGQSRRFDRTQLEGSHLVSDVIRVNPLGRDDLM